MVKPLVLALALLGSPGGCDIAGWAVQGSGVAVHEVREVADFTQVQLTGSFAVEVRLGTTASVRVEADDNIVPLITTSVVGSTLKISSRGDLSSTQPVMVAVTTPRLQGVDHSGSGSMQVQDIDSERFVVRMQGSGQVRLSGKAEVLTATIEGSGALRAADLVTDSASIDLGGSGTAEVQVRERLTVVLAGSGSVRYSGDPKEVTRQVRGSGTVAPL